MDEIPDDLLEMIDNVRTVQHFNVLNEIVDENHVSENWVSLILGLRFKKFHHLKSNRF